jgi:hypothetical protein
MLAIVTSLRARSLARDWEYHTWLLERSVHSMLAQTKLDVFVVVVCHDIPKSTLCRNNQVHFLCAKFPVPNRDNDDMCVDKVLKLSAGADWAISQKSDYLMFSDADDLVSNRIGNLISACSDAPGWYSAAELFYTYGGILFRVHVVQGTSSGPCVIVRSDLFEFALPPFTGEWTEVIKRGGEARYLDLLARHGEKTCLLAAVGLQNFREYMTCRGQSLRPIPFPANLVINHSDSTSHVAGGIGSYEFVRKRPRSSLRQVFGSLKRCARLLTTFRPVTAELRHEFSIPRIYEIPRRYRAGGSLFWR